VDCPAGIRITDIMYIIKRMAMQEKQYRRTIIPEIEQTIFKMVYKNGRLTESKVGMKVALKAGFLNLLSMVPIALKLRRKGRIKLLHTEKMAQPENLRAVLDLMEMESVAGSSAKPSGNSKAVTT